MTTRAPKAAYDILGVSPSDDFAAIRSAWRRLVKANHPDIVGGDPGAATRRLAEINDAYDALRVHNQTANLRQAEADAAARDEAKRAAEARRRAAARRAEAAARDRARGAAAARREAEAAARAATLKRKAEALRNARAKAVAQAAKGDDRLIKALLAYAARPLAPAYRPVLDLIA